MTIDNTNDLGWAPDPPSPTAYHPQAVVTEVTTEHWRVPCNTCGTYCAADAFEAAALHCYPNGATS